VKASLTSQCESVDAVGERDYPKEAPDETARARAPPHTALVGEWRPLPHAGTRAATAGRVGVKKRFRG